MFISPLRRERERESSLEKVLIALFLQPFLALNYNSVLLLLAFILPRNELYFAGFLSQILREALLENFCLFFLLSRSLSYIYLIHSRGCASG